MHTYNYLWPKASHGMEQLPSKPSDLGAKARLISTPGSWLSVTLMLLLLANHARAADYNILVEPVGSASRTEQVYQPLADYLASATGDNYQLTVPTNFQAFWQRVKRGSGFDLVISSGHIVDYLAEKQSVTPLVKVNAQRTYSLVIPKDSGVGELKNLVGKPIASLASPSMEFLQLSQFFPNPIQQPRSMEAESNSTALQMVLDGKAIGAIVTDADLEGHPTLQPLVSSDAIPSPALSVSQNIPEAKRKAISNALTTAQDSTLGADMLHRTGFSGFEAATADLYKGLSSMLSGLWGS